MTEDPLPVLVQAADRSYRTIWKALPYSHVVLPQWGTWHLATDAPAVWWMAGYQAQPYSYVVLPQ